MAPSAAMADHLRLPFLDEALASLLAAVEARMSTALIAPAGTGKTALLRRLRDGLPDARYHVHYVKVTGLSKRDMCREIAVACGAEFAGSYPMLVRRLQERFEATAHEAGRRPVLLFDESHELRPDVLGMLRILTNFDMDSRFVLSRSSSQARRRPARAADGARCRRTQHAALPAPRSERPALPPRSDFMSCRQGSQRLRTKAPGQGSARSGGLSCAHLVSPFACSFARSAPV
jgi:hypothetical protein